MKANKKKMIYSLVMIPIIIVLLLFGWFMSSVFEGEKPAVGVQPLPEYLRGEQKFSIQVSDKKRGLRAVKVSVRGEGQEMTVLDEKFPYQGFLNHNGIHESEKEVTIDPVGLKIPQGSIDLVVSVWDYSRRSGGDGNSSVLQHRMIVDTMPPSIRTVSRMHNINLGGSCAIVYETSSDTAESGVYVDDTFFPGFPLEEGTSKTTRICYFALPFDSKKNPSIYLWAGDEAGNEARNSFYYHIRRKRFREDRIRITDKFLDQILPYFAEYPLPKDADPLAKYRKINSDLRKENNLTFFNLRENTSPVRLWDGPWLRMKNAAPMAGFADKRSYFYNGEKIDEQFHMGIDLASLANAPVGAANNGKVILAEAVGIYGNTVVLDHGQGLASVYSHLSGIEVRVGQEVKKGEIIGRTGQTGLAGGDHLHYAVMVNGVFVNPIEWWDEHWIEDNINKKLEGLRVSRD